MISKTKTILFLSFLTAVFTVSCNDDDVQKIKQVLESNMVVEQGELLFLPIDDKHGVEKLTAVTQWKK